jgi:hypothetical protein
MSNMTLLLKKYANAMLLASNRPSNSISFVPAVGTTSGRLHCERVRILFLQTHRETEATKSNKNNKALFCCFRS